MTVPSTPNIIVSVGGVLCFACSLIFICLGTLLFVSKNRTTGIVLLSIGIPIFIVSIAVIYLADKLFRQDLDVTNPNGNSDTYHVHLTEDLERIQCEKDAHTERSST